MGISLDMEAAAIKRQQWHDAKEAKERDRIAARLGCGPLTPEQVEDLLRTKGVRRKRLWYVASGALYAIITGPGSDQDKLRAIELAGRYAGTFREDKKAPAKLEVAFRGFNLPVLEDAKPAKALWEGDGSATGDAKGDT